MSKGRGELLKLTPEISENLSRLRKLRKHKGLTLRELGNILGISFSSLSQYERGKGLPEPYNYNKLAEIFGWNKVKLSVRERPKPKLFLLRKVEDLERGRHYIIFESDRRNNNSVISFAWNDSIIFEYMGKRGIHHCFKAVHGGWSRTYTDYQLIGKKIQEVNVNGAVDDARI